MSLVGSVAVLEGMLAGSGAGANEVVSAKREWSELWLEGGGWSSLKLLRGSGFVAMVAHGAPSESALVSNGGPPIGDRAQRIA